MQNNEYLLTQPMSSDIMNKYFDGHANIVSLEQISHMTSLDDVMKEFNHAIIFFAITAQNSGHWLALFKNDSGLYFFDSYGMKPLDYLKGMARQDRPLFGQNLNLLNLIQNSQYANNFFYNDIEYQSEAENVSTCGRYCAVVCFLNTMIKGFDLDLFYYFMSYWKEKYNMSYDEIISSFVSSS